MYMYTHW